MDNCINAIVESAGGCRNKYKYDEKSSSYILKKTLPLGAAFPYDFGFVPNTKAADGDPIDIMILLEEPTFTGCVVKCRIIGAIMAEQTKTTTVRNDRLIAVAEASFEYGYIKELSELPKAIIDQVEHFFVSYNEMEGKKFVPIGRIGATDAMELLKQAIIK